MTSLDPARPMPINAPRKARKTQKPRGARTPRKALPVLELYQREDCPYSARVRSELSRLGLDFVAHNVAIHDDLKHQELVKASGKDQIPFLVDHRSGTKLGDSDAIVQYLRGKYGGAGSVSESVGGGSGTEAKSDADADTAHRRRRYRLMGRWIPRPSNRLLRGAISLAEYGLAQIFMRSALSKKVK